MPETTQTRPRSYIQHRRRPHYEHCGVDSAVRTFIYVRAESAGEGRRAPPDRSLEELLVELTQEKFIEGLAGVREGRESRFLAKQGLVGELIRAIKKRSDAAEFIEAELDRLFNELRGGEVFRHTETVMALLFALRAASDEQFREVSSVFASSSAAEIGRLRRFARKLLGK